jgi:hypothetical protein
MLVAGISMQEICKCIFDIDSMDQQRVIDKLLAAGHSMEWIMSLAWSQWGT